MDNSRRAPEVVFKRNVSCKSMFWLLTYIIIVPMCTATVRLQHKFIVNKDDEEAGGLYRLTNNVEIIC